MRVEVRDGTGYGVDVAGDGPPLLLLHGFAAAGAAWAAHVDVLRHHRRTLVVDLLGHGASDAPLEPARHAVPRQAADIADVLRQLRAEPADVLGYSFGARVALRLAIDHARSVDRLVLESPSAGIADATERAARRDADERWARLLDAGDMAAFLEAWEAQPLFASRARLPDAARKELAAIQCRNDPAALAASLRGAGQGLMEAVHSRLIEVRAPTLVIAGERDTAGRARAAAVAAGVPNARLVVVPGAGHTPHMEAPTEFGRLVTAFLETSPIDVAPPATPVS